MDGKMDPRVWVWMVLERRLGEDRRLRGFRWMCDTDRGSFFLFLLCFVAGYGNFLYGAFFGTNLNVCLRIFLPFNISFFYILYIILSIFIL